jgi:methylmalonyl-CoA mutase cobalamin-binding domain/chain
MQEKKLIEKMKTALIEFEVEQLKERVTEAISSGIPAEKIISILSSAMEIVGEKYQNGEYFVTSLILAGETMKEALEMLEPHLSSTSTKGEGKIVVATVIGDIHDIGKNIFATLIELAGFEVIDLGTDVSAETIIETVKEQKPNILGLSALLTTNLEQFPYIVDKLKAEDLKKKTKVIVGGATVTEEFSQRAGVDAYAKTAIEGVNICKEWTKKSRSQ